MTGKNFSRVSFGYTNKVLWSKFAWLLPNLYMMFQKCSGWSYMSQDRDPWDWCSGLGSVTCFLFDFEKVTFIFESVSEQPQ